MTSLCELVARPETTVEDVLVDPNLPNALQSELEDVVAFFARQENLFRLLQWSLTMKPTSNPNYMKFARLSMSVLCSESFDLSREVMDSDVLPSALSDFFGSRSLSSPFICGNFSRIVEKYARVPPGTLLDTVPDLVPNLLKHLGILAFRSLLARLLSEFRPQLGQETFDTYMRLFPAAIIGGGDIGYGSVTVVRDLLMAETRQFGPDFDCRPIFRAVLDFCCLETSTPLFRAEGFALCELIAQTGDGFGAIVDEYEAAVECAQPGIAGAAVFRVFRRRFSGALKQFLGNLGDSVVGDIVLSEFESTSLEERVRLVEANAMVDRVADAFSLERKCCGHLTRLAVLMNEIEAVKQSPRWQTFASGPLAAKLEVLGCCEKFDALRAMSHSELASWGLTVGHDSSAFQGSFVSDSDSDSGEEPDDADIVIDIARDRKSVV
jgi:hypothetical protein